MRREYGTQYVRSAGKRTTVRSDAGSPSAVVSAPAISARRAVNVRMPPPMFSAGSIDELHVRRRGRYAPRSSVVALAIGCARRWPVRVPEPHRADGYAHRRVAELVGHDAADAAAARQAHRDIVASFACGALNGCAGHAGARPTGAKDALEEPGLRRGKRVVAGREVGEYEPSVRVGRRRSRRRGLRADEFHRGAPDRTTEIGAPHGAGNRPGGALRLLRRDDADGCQQGKSGDRQPLPHRAYCRAHLRMRGSIWPVAKARAPVRRGAG
jgi:hypothetical protein